MRMRPITALVAALALLAAVPVATRAQDPTPTPTPTASQSQQDDGSSAEAPEGASAEVIAIYDDYSDDGKIEVCDHERTDLQDALDGIEADVDRDFPDFREAIRAGIQRHDGGRCDDGTATATATPDDGSTTADPTPAPTTESGELPPFDDGTTDDGSGALPPVDDGTLPPEDGTLPPESGAVPPPAATPAPVAPVRPPPARPRGHAGGRHPLGHRPAADPGHPDRRRAARRRGARRSRAIGARRSPRWQARLERGRLPRARDVGGLLGLAAARPLTGPAAAPPSKAVIAQMRAVFPIGADLCR